jgi:predicted flap endonuclease-1-like 5' DNA nuclease
MPAHSTTNAGSKNMNYKIQEIEGIGPALALKLAAAKITTTEELLDHCGTAKGRRLVAEKTALSEAQLLKWANMADLMRISGIGPEYAELLEAAGVDTVKELRNRNSENLVAAMKEINEQKRLTRSVPTQTVVAKWVEMAKTTEPKITY